MVLIILTKNLKRWAGRIEAEEKRVKAVFVYFNNDAYGFAVKNALPLKKVISQGQIIP